ADEVLEGVSELELLLVLRGREEGVRIPPANTVALVHCPRPMIPHARLVRPGFVRSPAPPAVLLPRRLRATESVVGSGREQKERHEQVALPGWGRSPFRLFCKSISLGRVLWQAIPDVEQDDVVVDAYQSPIPSRGSATSPYPA